MSKNGVRKGDRVLIYMPMIPETAITMLSCARIGAIHSLVFGGFASNELASRIKHAQVTKFMLIFGAALILPSWQIVYPAGGFPVGMCVEVVVCLLSICVTCRCLQC